MKRWTLIPTLLFTLINCRSTYSVNSELRDSLAGTWLFYEQGYSPGAGYIINKIPAKPEQTLTLTANGRIQAKGDGLKYYQSFNSFRTDTLNQVTRIYYSPSTTNYSETIRLSGDTLRLYQSCIEGCHLGFLRIK